jgi:hypothetical protein
MARRKKPEAGEYRFTIDVYEPDTMPLRRLTEYLNDLAEILGEDKSTHLIGIEKSSHCSVLKVDADALPKIEERAKEIERGDASPQIEDAIARMNRRLRLDNATGRFSDPDGHDIIPFLGRQNEALEYAITQVGTIDGIPIMVGGSKERVPVHLEGRQGEKHNCLANRTTAKAIADHLFEVVIRAEGIGRWIRHPEGQWEMKYFNINAFHPLGKVSDLSLRASIDELRSIPAKWKDLKDPIGELVRIRDDVEM